MTDVQNLFPREHTTTTRSGNRVNGRHDNSRLARRGVDTGACAGRNTLTDIVHVKNDSSIQEHAADCHHTRVGRHRLCAETDRRE